VYARLNNVGTVVAVKSTRWERLTEEYSDFEVETIFAAWRDREQTVECVFGGTNVPVWVTVGI
jgi:hypothetical protein